MKYLCSIILAFHNLFSSLVNESPFAIEHDCGQLLGEVLYAVVLAWDYLVAILVNESPFSILVRLWSQCILLSSGLLWCDLFLRLVVRDVSLLHLLLLLLRFGGLFLVLSWQE